MMKKFGILILISIFFIPVFSFAANIFDASDTQNRLKENTPSNHSIFFVTTSGVSSGENITLTFTSEYSNIGSMVSSDFDFAEGSTGTCSSAIFTEESLVDLPTINDFSITGSGQIITIQSGGIGATIAPGVCVRLRAGLNATNLLGSGPGVNQIINGPVSADDHSITIDGTFGDYGIIYLAIYDDDQVSVSATVLDNGQGNNGGNNQTGYIPPENLQAPASISFSGTAFPFAHLYVLKDGQNFLSTTASANSSFYMIYPNINPGIYVFTVFVESNTGVKYNIGTWTIEIKKGMKVEITGITIPQDVWDLLFNIQIPEVTPKPYICSAVPADFNCDRNVDLSDLSILLYFYKLRNFVAKYDINKDREVELGDFSVLAYYWTG